jgi:hypothetical protein
LQTKNEDKREQLVEGLIMKSNSNNSSKIGTNYSPAVTSSRYSNTNTAYTRNLFTPSEDNCLSQHLAGYSNANPKRVVCNSDLVHLKTERERMKEKIVWNIVEEEGSKEEANTDDSMTCLKQHGKKRKTVQENDNFIMIDNQEKNNSSMIQLEGVIDSLLKEQVNLKNKIMDQEKRITKMVLETEHDEEKARSIKPSPSRLIIKRHSIKKEKTPESTTECSTNNASRNIQKERELRIKVRSTPKCKSKTKVKLIKPVNAQQVRRINMHRRSVNKDIQPAWNTNFLEKAVTHVNKNHNIINNSLGREKVGLENKVKLLQPQYANDVIMESQNLRESSKKMKRKLISKNCEISKRPPRNMNEFSNLKNQFITLDHRNQMDNMALNLPIRTSANSLDTRKRMYSSVESVNLPKINAAKGSSQPPPLRKSASYSTKQSRKLWSNLVKFTFFSYCKDESSK